MLGGSVNHNKKAWPYDSIYTFLLWSRWVENDLRPHGHFWGDLRPW